MSGHPPFGAQVILNGHEYLARQAGNCFTEVGDGTDLAQLAETFMAGIDLNKPRLRAVLEAVVSLTLSPSKLG